MPPLADAVGLVHREQAGFDSGHDGEEAGAAEALGRNVHQAVAAGLDLLHAHPLVGWVKSAIDQGRASPRWFSASTWSFIRAIKGLITSVTPGRSRAGNW